MRAPWPAVLTALAAFLVMLPAFLFLWYQAGPWLVPALVALLEPMLTWLWPDTVIGVEPAGRKLIVITELVSTASIPPRKGVLVNPFTYSYSLPLFAALALASTASFLRHLLRLAIGMGVLTLGVCFSILVSLLYLFQLDDGYAGLQFSSRAELNEAIVRYAHFLGFNLTPRVLPLLMWILLYREWLAELMREFRRAPPPAA
ncbi:MAG: hypothetical protein EOM91_03345 [Sphingobacteriia bacterium]|nr:hypothetical protein [Sphingobacteriia bacterium]NCC40045.1 hypothetical protein [Gammaproteobacteria bacterium]